MAEISKGFLMCHNFRSEAYFLKLGHAVANMILKEYLDNTKHRLYLIGEPVKPTSITNDEFYCYRTMGNTMINTGMGAEARWQSRKVDGKGFYANKLYLMPIIHIDGKIVVMGNEDNDSFKYDIKRGVAEVYDDGFFQLYNDILFDRLDNLEYIGGMSLDFNHLSNRVMVGDII